MLETTHDDKLLFLETTIQIDRIIGTQERRNTIRHNVQTWRLCTSAHVLGEFNRTLISDAVIFRNLLLSSPNLQEAVKRLGSYDRRFPRTVGLLATLGFDRQQRVKDETVDRGGYSRFFSQANHGPVVILQL